MPISEPIPMGKDLRYTNTSKSRVNWGPYLKFEAKGQIPFEYFSLKMGKGLIPWSVFRVGNMREGRPHADDKNFYFSYFYVGFDVLLMSHDN